MGVEDGAVARSPEERKALRKARRQARKAASSEGNPGKQAGARRKARSAAQAGDAGVAPVEKGRAKAAGKGGKARKGAARAARAQALPQGNDALQDRKVFCLGFDQAGNEALRSFLAQRGLAASGNGRWAQASQFAAKHRSLSAKAFCGGEQANFVNLDAWFPGSLFVLQTTDELTWLQGRIRHVLRHAADNWTGRKHGGAPRPPYGGDALMQAFFPAPTLCIDRWILDRRQYHAAVREYFLNRDNLVDINLGADLGWQDTLSAALDAFDLLGPEPSSEPAPEADVPPALTFQTFPLLQDYLDLAAERVAAMGPDTRPYSHADFLRAHAASVA